MTTEYDNKELESHVIAMIQWHKERKGEMPNSEKYNLTKYDPAPIIKLLEKEHFERIERVKNSTSLWEIPIEDLPEDMRMAFYKYTYSCPHGGKK